MMLGLVFPIFRLNAHNVVPIIVSSIVTGDDVQNVIHQGDLIFPLTSRYTFTNDYGRYTDGTGAHWGVDLHTEVFSPVLSVSAGVVIETMDGARNNPLPSDYHEPPYVVDGTRGNYVTIQTQLGDDVRYFRYMHLSPNTLIVKAGDVVEAGQKIAEVGNSGLSWGAHLHFEVRLGLGASNQDTLDPKTIMYFGERGHTYEPHELQATQL